MENIMANNDTIMKNNHHNLADKVSNSLAQINQLKQEKKDKTTALYAQIATY